jgi:hypothetical protein
MGYGIVYQSISKGKPIRNSRGYILGLRTTLEKRLHFGEHLVVMNGSITKTIYNSMKQQLNRLQDFNALFLYRLVSMV